MVSVALYTPFLHVGHTAGRSHCHGLGGIHAGAAAESSSSRCVEQVAACRSDAQSINVSHPHTFRIQTHPQGNDVNRCRESVRLKLLSPSNACTRDGWLTA